MSCAPLPLKLTIWRDRMRINTILIAVFIKKYTSMYRNTDLRFVTWSSLITSDFLADDSCGLGRSKSVLNQSCGLLCNGKVLSGCSGDLYNLAKTHMTIQQLSLLCVKTMQQHLSYISVITLLTYNCPHSSYNWAICPHNCRHYRTDVTVVSGVPDLTLTRSVPNYQPH